MRGINEEFYIDIQSDIVINLLLIKLGGCNFFYRTTKVFFFNGY